MLIEIIVVIIKFLKAQVLKAQITEERIIVANYIKIDTVSLTIAFARKNVKINTIMTISNTYNNVFVICVCVPS